MSIDIKWDTITSGPDGEALAEKIREFVHDKFQQVTLPRFIRSVAVHSFDFGKACPELEIKDICDPLPDFYEEDEEDDSDASPEEKTRSPPRSAGQEFHGSQNAHNATDPMKPSDRRRPTSMAPLAIDPRLQAFNSPMGLGSPFRSGTPGIPGGTSNLSYFHLPMGGISGTQTPLAAVASGTPLAGWLDMQHPLGNDTHGNSPGPPRSSQDSTHADPQSRPSTARTLAPQSPESLVPTESHTSSHDLDDTMNDLDLDDPSSPRMTEKNTEDIQVVCRVKYSGDVSMSLTTEILLDYPMPSFVGIPLKLSITGMKFDGVAIVAYIRKRAHFCFLSPEDAQAIVGNEDDDTDGSKTSSGQGVERSLGGLLQEIEVESEIGKKENGKQVLKNVSKVEKFVLEQVRRIFEDEFVFPSFWTFLV